jgi:S-adenosylmethionine hydrolase
MAWAEICSVFTANLEAHVKMHLTAVRSFDTIATGFVLAQLSLAEEQHRPKGMLVFANTAPRKDRHTPKVNNEGEGLLFAKLKNGVFVVAVNSGYSLSFIMPEIAELWSTNAEEHGSQFRSRDFFPRIVRCIAIEDFSCLQHRLDPENTIPEVPPNIVAYIDSFGNLKTTFRSGDKLVSPLSSGMRVKIKIGGIVRAATVATGSFNVMEGDLAFAPGSSGQDRRYWELFTRGGSASEEFHHPAAGSEISIETAGS